MATIRSDKGRLLIDFTRRQADQFRTASEHYASVVIPEYGVEVTRLRAEVAEARRALEGLLTEETIAATIAAMSLDGRDKAFARAVPEYRRDCDSLTKAVAAARAALGRSPRPAPDGLRSVDEQLFAPQEREGERAMSESQGRDADDDDALLEYEAATRNYDELRRGEIGECLNAVHGDAKPCSTCVVCRLAEARRQIDDLNGRGIALAEEYNLLREQMTQARRAAKKAIGLRLVDWNLDTIDADWTDDSREAAGHVLTQVANVLFREVAEGT